RGIRAQGGPRGTVEQPPAPSGWQVRQATGQGGGGPAAADHGLAGAAGSGDGAGRPTGRSRAAARAVPGGVQPGVDGRLEGWSGGSDPGTEGGGTSARRPVATIAPPEGGAIVDSFRVREAYHGLAFALATQRLTLPPAL